MEDKECSNCLAWLPLSKFSRCKGKGEKFYYNKICNKCKRAKYPEDIENKREYNRKWARENRDKTSAYHKKWYQKDISNRAYLSLKLQEARDRNIKYVVEYLLSHPCVGCGNTDIEVLEFDHLDPKSKDQSISRAVGRGYSLKRLSVEIGKCQVLCANCHRKKTNRDIGGTARTKLLKSLGYGKL